jgi:septal ring factor EnvC (AmiA/AmiB activator)
MSIQVLRPVTIKAKVTEGLKARLAQEIQDAIRLLDQEMEQIESQVKRAQLTATVNPQQLVQLRQIVEAEKAKRAERKAELQEEIQAIQSLPLGSEIVQGTAQSIATIDVGSDFDALRAVEIVVEDGKVVAIRRG